MSENLKFSTNGSGGEERPALSAADAAIVDRLLGREGSSHGLGVPRGVDEAQAAREGRVQEWLKVLSAAPVAGPSGDLAGRTLEAIQRDRMRIPAAAPREVDVMPHVRRKWSRRVAELGAMAVAASILGVVAFVGLQQMQHSQARVACSQNLELLAKGLGTYASQNSGALPMLAAPANGNWAYSLEPGTARTNAANLWPAIEQKYIMLANLQCAGANLRRATPPAPETRPGATGPVEVASDYSYVHLYSTGAAKPRWNGSAAMVILADRNPLFAGESLPVTVSAGATNRNSPNHDEKGNYVLHADGHVSWETTPNVGAAGDNLWTVNAPGTGGTGGVQRVLTYRGVEAPSSGADVFVCP